MKTPNSLTQELEKNSESNASNTLMDSAASGSKTMQEYEAPSINLKMLCLNFGVLSTTTIIQTFVMDQD
jgi:hypothetical protein